AEEQVVQQKGELTREPPVRAIGDGVGRVVQACDPDLGNARDARQQPQERPGTVRELDHRAEPPVAREGSETVRYDETKPPAGPVDPANRSNLKGAGLTAGREPVTRAATISPTAGESLKPWPDIPVTIHSPATGDSSRMGIQSGVMSKAPT